jgi:hypothetical protein
MGGIFRRNGLPFQPDGAAIGMVNAGSALISVDFPAPFSPNRAMISPRRRLKLTLSSALTPGKIC